MSLRINFCYSVFYEFGTLFVSINSVDAKNIER